MIELLPLVGAVAVLARICWTDFYFLKIYNRDLLVLAGLVVAYLALARPEDIGLRLALGVILFAIAFVFWLAGKLGAGDAKLLGIAGVLIEPEDAMLFAILLLVFAAGLYLLFAKAEALKYMPAMAGRRMMELIEARRVPYGIPIALSTIALLAGRLASHL